MANYTPQEAAVLAGANLRSVQKAITEKRIKVRRKAGRRLIDDRSIAVIAVSASLPDEWKIPIRKIEEFMSVLVVPHHGRDYKVSRRAGAVFSYEPVSIDPNGVWTFNVQKVLPAVQERMALYEKAKRGLVERNPEILGGTPVIAGTRLNIYAIAARLEGGESLEELQAEYPYVTREQLEAARLYAKANPLRGRPGGRPWLKKKSRKR